MALKLASLAVCSRQNFSLFRQSTLPKLLQCCRIANVHFCRKQYCHRSEDVQKLDYKIFYRFPHIRLARFLSRLKIYQTGATVIAIPPAVYCYSIGLVGIESCVAAACLSTLAMALLYIAGNFFRRLIGLVALSSDERVVRISRLTFWGNRKDIYVSPDDVVPLTEFEDNLSDAYVRVRLYSQADVLYMFLRYGTVEDRVMFAKIFGNHS